jgi:hypothetical protein
MNKLLIVSAIALIPLGGCAVAPKQQQTSLQIQSIQSKNFAANEKTTFHSVMSVLQDLGYIVQSASLDTGFITANSPTVQDRSSGAIFAAMLAHVTTQNKTEVTASIEQISANLTRVRLNFVTETQSSGAYGRNQTSDKQILDPKIYQNAFNKIGDAIFIRKNS